MLSVMLWCSVGIMMGCHSLIGRQEAVCEVPLAVKNFEVCGPLPLVKDGSDREVMRTMVAWARLYEECRAGFGVMRKWVGDGCGMR